MIYDKYKYGTRNRTDQTSGKCSEVSQDIYLGKERQEERRRGQNRGVKSDQTPHPLTLRLTGLRKVILRYLIRYSQMIKSLSRSLKMTELTSVLFTTCLQLSTPKEQKKGICRGKNCFRRIIHV